MDSCENSKLIRADHTPGIRSYSKEGHVAKIQQTCKTNDNVEAKGQDNVVTCISIPGQATICAGAKQERIEHGIEEHKGNEEYQVKTLCTGTSQRQIVGDQILRLFKGASSRKCLQLL